MKKKKDEMDIFVESIIKGKEFKSYSDVSNLIDKLQQRMMQTLLEGELDYHLGYKKNSHEVKSTKNARNGYVKPKKVKTKTGEIIVKTPRDREGSFEPALINKRQTIIDEFDKTAISLYAKGVSLRDIEVIIEDAYKIKLNKEQIMTLISRVNEEVIKWQNRPLKSIYPFVYVDCLYVPIKKELISQKRAVYVIVGIDLEGKKEIIGIWIGENEAASFWSSIFENLRSRGVEEIIFLSMDGLTGLKETVETVYPKTITQRCIVHLVRNLYNICNKKEAREVITDFKKIYTSSNLEESKMEYEKFILKYESSKKIIDKVSSYMEYIYQLMEYPSEIRKMIYTTNTIEAVNSALRKVTRGKGSFPSEESVMKVLYLRVIDLEKKWIKPVKGWSKILNQLIMLFEERITSYLE